MRVHRKRSGIDAIEIRLRATRRIDELRRAQKETMGLSEGGRPKTGFSDNPVSKPTLASRGIEPDCEAPRISIAVVEMAEARCYSN